MLVIGLTGGIASGKTTVANYFAAFGVPIIDADLIAHELTEPKTPCTQTIIDHFGSACRKEDGSLNRQYLREQIFKFVAERKWLESLLHPLITCEIKTRLQKLEAAYCIVVIPLLIETGPHAYIDRIAVVDLNEEEQLKRLKARDNTSLEASQNIIASQVSREVRQAHAVDLITNDGSLTHLKEQVKRLDELYIALSRKD